MAGRIAYLGNISPQGLVLDLDAGIKGSYPGVGTTWSDISNNGNNGTLINGPAFTGSNYGAIVFDGTNDYVTLPNTLTAPSAVTMTFWINKAFTNQYLSINSRNNNTLNGTVTGAGYGPVSSNGWVQLGYIGDGTNNYFTVNGIRYTTNTGGVFPYDVANSNTIFSMNNNGYFAGNNAPVTSFALSPSAGGFTGYQWLDRNYKALGVLTTAGNQRFFSGSIGISQFHSRVLSDFEIFQNFNAYKSRYGIPDIVTDGLALNLDAGNPYSYLSGSSGTTWTNTVAVSSSISGTLVNGPVYSNGAVTFDGVNDYVNTSLQTLDRPCTFSVWVNLSSLTGWQTFFGQDTSAAILRGRYYFQKASVNNEGVIQNKVNFQIVLSDNSIVPVNANNVMAINTWYNYTAVLTTTSISLYENGILQNTVNNSNVFLPTSTPTILNAGYYDNRIVDFVNGKTSNFLVYNRALSATEVQQNFNALRGRYGI